MTYRRSGPWPECVGESLDKCVGLIEASSEDVTVEAIYPDEMYTEDFRVDRVRVFVDSDQVVLKIPQLG